MAFGRGGWGAGALGYRVLGYQLIPPCTVATANMGGMPILVNTVNYPNKSQVDSPNLDETVLLLKEESASSAFVGISDATDEDMQALRAFWDE